MPLKLIKIMNPQTQMIFIRHARRSVALIFPGLAAVPHAILQQSVYRNLCNVHTVGHKDGWFLHARY